MTRAEVTEAEVQARLARLRSGQPWSGLGAIVTVVGVMILLAERKLEALGVDDAAIYGAAMVLLVAGAVLQYAGWRKRKASEPGGGAR